MGWTLRGLLEAALLSPEGSGETSTDAPISGLAYDSREVADGDLFFCVPGERADGHDHAPAAIEAGAAALVVERPLDLNVPQARVPSVRDAMGPLASAFFGHPSEELAVGAVTGTNGKTTITYLLESIARAAGDSPGVVGTVSRRYAGTEEPAPRNTPEAIDLQRLLRRMHDAGVDVAFLEATSDGLAQGRLRGMRFATAGFTNLTQDHLNTHGSMDAYFEAKASLFDAAYTPRAVLNVADPYGRRIADGISPGISTGIEVLTYGTENADIACLEAELRSSGTTALVRTPAGEMHIEIDLVGRYNVDNCLCAIGMALGMGFGRDQIAKGLHGVSNVPGRLERIDGGQSFLALVDYAHTPDALTQALRACRELATGRLIVVFGCGGDRDRAKRPLMGEAATSIADVTYITSDNPRSEDPAAIVGDIEVGAERGGGEYRIVVDRRSAIAEALANAKDGDVVLVAGKGHEQGQQFADHTVAFDDRDVVREILETVACPR